MQKDGAGSCLVVPEYPGISFDSFYAASFRIGPSDLLAGKTVVIDMSTKEFADFANAHESWHCLDIRYMQDTGDGLEGAVKQNRAEMFADIGGVMEGIRNGADLSLIDKAAALRATWAFLTGPTHAKSSTESDQHFASIVYATEDGLDALEARIEKMGVDNFRKLDREQLRALDYEITDDYCLTYAQAQALEAYYATGQAPAAALPRIARLKAIAAASVRAATPAELAARERIAQEASNNGGLTEAVTAGSASGARARTGQRHVVRQPVAGAAGNDRQPARQTPPRSILGARNGSAAQAAALHRSSPRTPPGRAESPVNRRPFSGGAPCPPLLLVCLVNLSSDFH